MLRRPSLDGKATNVNRVFISYEHADSAIAVEIAEGLAAAGYQAWYYERDTLPGLTYLTQVRDAIRGSKAIVLIVSKRTLGSVQVSNEVTAGLEHKLFFVPLLNGIDYAAIQRRRPEWAMALGSAASIPIPAEGVPAVLPRMLRSLKQRGIVGSAGTQFAEPPQVRVLRAGKPDQVVPLRESGLTLGRDPDVDVVLLDTEVSRRHVRLEWNHGHVDVTDLSSKNGTKVGGVRLAPNQPLSWNPDDLMEIGPFQLRLEVPSLWLAREAVGGEPRRR
jgi:hypothetical protein